MVTAQTTYAVEFDGAEATFQSEPFPIHESFAALTARMRASCRENAGWRMEWEPGRIRLFRLTHWFSGHCASLRMRETVTEFVETPMASEE